MKEVKEEVIKQASVIQNVRSYLLAPQLVPKNYSFGENGYLTPPGAKMVALSRNY